MAQRVAVITGASSGVGKETAKTLAAQGWHVIAMGRDAGRCAAAEAEIRAAAKGGKVNMVRANLGLMADTARAVREISALTDRVDVLVNSAGGMCKGQVITPEGFEENFTGNHLGPFLLTTRLLPLLRRAAASAPKGSVRIINVSSDASEMIDGFDWDDFAMIEKFNPGMSYCRSKLANVLFARGLAQRFAKDGIIAHSVHPGTVDSNFFSHADERSQAYMQTLKKLTCAEGADTVIWLATADEPGQTNGGYYHERKPRKPNPKIDDEAYVTRMWDESEKLVTRAGI